jgi:hypothetical protein
MRMSGSQSSSRVYEYPFEQPEADYLEEIYSGSEKQ